MKDLIRFIAFSCVIFALSVSFTSAAEDTSDKDLLGQLFGAVKETVGTTIEKNKADEAVKKREAAEQEAIRAERQKAAEEKAKAEAEQKKAEAQLLAQNPAPANPVTLSRAVDPQGKPVVDAQGRQVFVDAQGKPVVLDAQGNPVAADPPGKPGAAKKDPDALTDADKKFRFETEKNQARDQDVSQRLSEQLKLREQQAQDKLSSEKKN